MNRVQLVTSTAVTPKQQKHIFPATGATRTVIRNTRPKNKRILFVCRANRMRSTTAETLYMATPGIEARSAGVSDSAPVPVTSKLLHWADIVFVMEPYMREHLLYNFPNAAGSTPILCLHIADVYPYMDTSLVNLLLECIGQVIGAPHTAASSVST